MAGDPARESGSNQIAGLDQRLAPDLPQKTMERGNDDAPVGVESCEGGESHGDRRSRFFDKRVSQASEDFCADAVHLRSVMLGDASFPIRC